MGELVFRLGCVWVGIEQHLNHRIVFGTRVVMVPAYIAAIAMKAYCALDLLVNPSCAVKVLRLYNVHSIYTWCRFFVFIFKNS